jgi:hypothetical protein
MGADTNTAGAFPDVIGAFLASFGRPVQEDA